MLNQSLIISFPQNLASLKRTLASHHPVFYLCFGDNYRVRRNLEEKLGKGFVRLDIARLHDQVADEIRAEHVAWIDYLNRIYGGNLEWWFGPIASRNVYCSKLFQYSCYLEILKRIWDKADKRPRLIITGSAGLAKAISKWASERGISVRCRILARTQALTDYIRAFGRWSYFALGLLMRQVAARSSGKGCCLDEVGSQDLAIVDTFVHDSCLSEDGVFTDHYFPYLHEFLKTRGFRLLVHPVLYGFGLHYLSVYRRMRRSNTRFIIPEDYLKWSDYFYILTQPLRAARRRIRAPRFRSFDLSDLIIEEQRNLADELSLTAGQIYQLFLRLGESGLAPKLVINWYENQAIDKALIAGSRQAFPQARIIGAQIFLHLSNMLNLFPSPAETAAGMAPHLLLETSEYQCSVARTFTADLACVPAAALRQNHIFKEFSQGEGQGENKAILVLLPFDVAESVEILDTLKRGLNRLDNQVPLLVKCHPDLHSEKLLQVFGRQNWPARFEIFQGSLPAALSRARVVISANSSSILEAVIKGIPAIFLGRETVLNQKIMLRPSMDVIEECFNLDELVLAIERNLALRPEDLARKRAAGEKVRDLLFLPVTHETLMPFTGNVG